MMTPDLGNGLPDPYGLPLTHHVEMLNEIGRLVEQIVRLGPWHGGQVHAHEPPANERP